MELKEAAHALVDAGFNVIPIKENAKFPIIRWTWCQERDVEHRHVEAWWRNWPFSNVGIVTGAVSRLVVVDVDSLEAAKAVRFKKAKPTVFTPRGHHIWFEHPGYPVPNTSNKLDWLDVRGDGGYVIAPPSIVGDKPYEWAATDVGKLPPMPKWVLDISPLNKKEDA